VEYNLHGINQVQMHDDIGLNFASALRSFLRQDPDIIMVGEIRDFETAEIAVKAALTGHMVLSTLHTNDAPSTISRLLNMGIEPFLVTASVNLILAQRLARRICAGLQDADRRARERAARHPDQAERHRQLPGLQGPGLRTCSETGYKGRVALYEVMDFSEELKEFVINGASAAEIKAEAIRLGMQTLRMAALNKFKEGVTTIEEVTRTSASD
jgi:type IV pilus assembly protein PilB